MTDAREDLAAGRAAYEIKSIRLRLELDNPARRPGQTIGVVRPDGQRAVLELARQGLVDWGWGEGRDEGVMLVRAAATGRAPPYPRGGGFGGGGAA